MSKFDIRSKFEFEYQKSILNVKVRYPAPVPSQFVLKSIRTQVNSYLFWSIRTQNYGQFVLIWSILTHVWSVRTHFGQFVLILVNSYSNSNEYELTKMSTN